VTVVPKVEGLLPARVDGSVPAAGKMPAGRYKLEAYLTLSNKPWKM